MKSNLIIKNIRRFFLAGIVAICVLGCGPKHIEGTPDVVGSFKLNRDANLIVVSK